MTPHEIELAAALGECAGGYGARFCRDIAFAARSAPEREITERQRYYMEILAWRYRRQLAEHLVPFQKPIDLPAKRRPPKMAKPTKREVERELMPDLFRDSHGQTGS